MKKTSVYNIPDWDFESSEFFEVLKESSNLKIERIISKGNVTADEFWYNQPSDEWVILIQGKAKIEFSDGKITKLESGDHLFIPKFTKHRVVETSTNPLCIWIAVHADFK